VQREESRRDVVVHPGHAIAVLVVMLVVTAILRSTERFVLQRPASESLVALRYTAIGALVAFAWCALAIGAVPSRRHMIGIAVLGVLGGFALAYTFHRDDVERAEAFASATCAAIGARSSACESTAYACFVSHDAEDRSITWRDLASPTVVCTREAGRAQGWLTR